MSVARNKPSWGWYEEVSTEGAFWLLVNVMALFYGAFVAGLFTGLFLVH
ncbi:hypothetical protein H2136_18115 [Aeromonas hydrophila]|uniref:Uncharacterized protein n=1 Tax=Aeromonas hydrophila TaxID=644 RepID=A0A926FNV5_AERHY|nr:hypothetical protein [Aeromonas hydrophila]